MTVLRGAAGVALFLGAVSCGSGTPKVVPAPVGVSGTPGAVGASIAVLSDGHVAVVNPDQGSVSFLDPTTLAVLGTTSVGGEPHALVEVPLASGPAVAVPNYRQGELVFVDEAKRTVLNRVSVCAGPYGVALTPDASAVLVSCEWAGTLANVDTKSFAVSVVASGLRRPRAVAAVGTEVYVADFVGGQVHEISSSGASTQTSLVPLAASYRPALTLMSANLTAALVPAFGSLFVSHVLENNAGNETAEPEAEDYGSVTSTNPKINPSLTTYGGSQPVLYAEYDGGPRVYSGPSAVAAFGSRYLLVAHVSTANVAVIDTQATTTDTRAVGTFQVGAGPSGIAVDASRQVAYVDNALDQSVSILDLTQPLGVPAQILAQPSITLVRDLPSPYSAEALAGRRLFFDATNPHVTPSGVVACASCHPGGSDDGLVWLINTPNIPTKSRRTPHLANAKTATAPFHWNGQFSTMSDLVTNTMTNLMAGDALLVDVGSIQPFIDEIVQPPVLPVTDAASVARGEALFQSSTLACNKCHEGSYFTDDKLHTVLSPMSLLSADVIPTSNTPGLHGIFLMAPYFHDGRAATLYDVLTQPYASEMDHTTGLDSGSVNDLIAYLESL
jgi:DNA-binding beta-propeller fold protein YncE